MKRTREVEDASQPKDSEALAVPHPVSKFTQLDSAVSDTEDPNANAPIMRCSLPPHQDPVSFRSYYDYEAHYARDHSYRCMECHRNLPSEHLLNVHIEECHDSILAVKRERGEKTFSCFVESCERKCSTPQKRRMHLIDKHMYPKNFFFAVTRDGVDGRRSLLHEGVHHRRRSSSGAQTKASQRRSSLRSDLSAPPSPGKTESEHKADAQGSTVVPDKLYASPNTPPDTPNAEMEDLADAMSGLKFLPRGIRFGRGRAGFARS